MQTGLEITRVDQVDCPELLVSGRMDGYWSRHLGEALDELMREGTHRVRINLSKTAYISSAGIRVLLQGFKQFSAVGGTLVVVDPSPPVQQVLDLAGLGSLLSATGAAEADTTRSPTARYEEGDCWFETYAYRVGGQLSCRVGGRPERLASGSFDQDDAMPLALPPDVFALGSGAFGDSYEACADRFGEFLAVAGCAAGQPGDETGYADYMVTSGEFLPRVMSLYYLSCSGEFTKLLRFETSPSARPTAFSKIVTACLAASDAAAAGIVMVAESAGILGASLKRAPKDAGSLFHYPEVRQWLSFSPVRSYRRSVVILAGVAAQIPVPARLLPLLRPLGGESGLLGHFHAAAFGYHPIRKGFIELEPLVKQLFETGGLQGVVHLLADDRPGLANESEFTRGACWVGPVGPVVAAEERL